MKTSSFEINRGIALVLALATGGALGGAACNKSEPSGKSALSATPPSPESTKLFGERCAVCHGAGGLGDGPASAALSPKPRNYTDKAWQASVTDEQIRKTIVYGGAAVGKSPSMPSSPELDAKPEVVEGLLKIVRGFGH